MTRSTPRSRVLSLDEEAGAFLDLLVDLGHLDEKLLALMNDRLLDHDSEDGMVHAADVRRVAAELMDEHRGDADPEYQRTLDLEWGLLFG